MPNAKPKFTENEKVLCYHGPLLYEAKCIKTRKDTSKGAAPSDFQYYVHYQGWKKNWDEWVNEDRMLKMGPEGLEKKEQLFVAYQQALKDKKKSSKSGGGSSSLAASSPASTAGGAGASKGTSSAGSSTGNVESKSRSDSANTSRASTPISERSERSSKTLKRVMADDETSVSSKEDDTPIASRHPKKSRKSRQREDKESVSFAEESDLDAEEADDQNTRFRIQVPDDLKFVLISDWNLVVNRKFLFNLPAKVSAASIISDFLRHIDKTQKSKLNIVQEIMLGIKDMFNDAINQQLLYKLERNQFEMEMENTTKDPIEIYGSAHLLRLMVKLNNLLNATNIDTESDIDLIESVINDFLAFLEASTQKYFTSKNYSEASEEYLKECDVA